MTDRERWIVYPLLFMALGISLKDKIFHEIRPEQVICKRLVVVDEDEQPMVELRGSPSGGLVTVNRTDETLALTLGHRGNTSSLFLDQREGAKIIDQPVLGNLRYFALRGDAPTIFRFPWLTLPRAAQSPPSGEAKQASPAAPEKSPN